MKRMWNKLSVLLLIGCQLAAPAAFCAIPRSNPLSFDKLKLWVFMKPIDFSKGLDASLIQPIESTRSFKYEDIAKIIPRDLVPTSDSGAVAARIVDYSLSNFMNSEAVRNSDLGRTAVEVEKSMETGVEYQSEAPEAIKHSLKFAVRATQTRAQIEYSGLTNARLSYSIARSTIDLEVQEDVEVLKSQFVYNHVTSRDENKDILSLRWGF